MIVDTFPLEYEREVLLIRLRELRGVVGKHVIIEAPETFSGNQRALFWPTICDEPEFREFRRKIDYRVIGFTATEPWMREQEMRDATLTWGRAACEKPSDLILLGDVDEIPTRQAVAEAAVMGSRSRKSWKLRLPTRYHQLRLNLRAAGSPGHLWEFRQPVIAPFRVMMTTTGVDIRAESGRLAEPQMSPGEPLLGWHFSCQGSAEQVRRKLSAGAHTEWAWLTEAHVARRISEREELCRRDKLIVVTPEEMPDAVNEDPDRFAHLMLGGQE